MELGFALPHLGPIATRDNIRQVAVEAERLGYHSLWTNERLLKPVNPRTPYPGNPEGVLDWQYETVFEHLTTLTFASALTERIRLGVSLINLPFHNPVQLAKRIATMDQLSNGRIDVGLGLGWSEDEADVTNTPFETRGRGRTRRCTWARSRRSRGAARAGSPTASPPAAHPSTPSCRCARRSRPPPPTPGATARGCRRSCAASCTAPTSGCPTRAGPWRTGPGTRSTRTACAWTRPASRSRSSTSTS